MLEKMEDVVIMDSKGCEDAVFSPAAATLRRDNAGEQGAARLRMDVKM